MRSNRVFGLAVTALVATGCLDSAPVAPNSSPTWQGSVQASIRARGRVTYDDRLAYVALQVPAFGGYFTDASGQVTIIVSDEGAGRAALSAARAVFPDLRGHSDSSIRFERGDYGFGELYEWHARLSDALGLSSVVMTDIDERRNRIVVGALDMQDPELLSLLESSGVPEEAVVVRQASRIYTLATLRDKHRPTFGGIEINVEDMSDCSLGFNAVLSGDTIAMTAGHCTETWGSDTNDDWYQHYEDPSNKIGVERAEASFFTSSTDPACPSGKDCRYEDVALADYSSGVGALMKVGLVTDCGIGMNDTGSITLTPTKTRTVTWEQTSNPFSVRKVGRTTGCTQGDVTVTCTNIEAYSAAHDKYGYFLCVNEVEASAQGGDSGAPVYAWSGSNAGAAGIAFAGGLWGYYYSTWEAIEDVYGNLDPIN